jgi:hypothetical protein
MMNRSRMSRLLIRLRMDQLQQTFPLLRQPRHQPRHLPRLLHLLRHLRRHRLQLHRRQHYLLRQPLKKLLPKQRRLQMLLMPQPQPLRLS